MPLDADIPDELGDYVPAVFAGTVEEAEEYRQLLDDRDIPAVIDEEYEPPLKAPKRPEGVPVLVPESLLEDARAVLAQAQDLAIAEEDEEEDDTDEFEEDGQQDGQDQEALGDEDEDDEDLLTDEEEEDEEEGPDDGDEKL